MPFMPSGGSCDRSQTGAWPAIAARKKGLALSALLACSGATTDAAFHPFKGQHAQLVDLGSKYSKVNYVTATFGGNDLGFAGILTHCFLGSCTKRLKRANREVNDVGAAVRTHLPLHEASGHPQSDPRGGLSEHLQQASAECCFPLPLAQREGGHHARTPSDAIRPSPPHSGGYAGVTYCFNPQRPAGARTLLRGCLVAQFGQESFCLRTAPGLGTRPREVSRRSPRWLPAHVVVRPCLAARLTACL